MAARKAKRGASNAARETKKPKAAGKRKSAAKAKDAKKSAERGVLLDFNHAMLYSSDVGRAVEFYCKRLGFAVVDDFRHEGHLLYARLRAPSGNGSIAVHQLAPGKTIPAEEGVRLYFEVRGLDEFCRVLESKGRVLDSLPKSMPWDGGTRISTIPTATKSACTGRAKTGSGARCSADALRAVFA
jgi:catechol 2,3-dioxygenase-like lactoylglutathione lyase family enzyme